MMAKLALEDGTIFTGQALGATGTRTGEVVFNTAMTGYQEVFSDPSYCGQIVTMTFPLMGNYGLNPEDFESAMIHLSGVVVREVPRRPSNFRATMALPEFLRVHGVLGIAGVDTRALTRRLRIHGALRGVLSTELLDDLALVQQARAADEMAGANLVTRVAPAEVQPWSESLLRLTELRPQIARAAEGSAAGHQPAVAVAAPPDRAPRCHIVAVDCGAKYNILRHLVDSGCRVTGVPASASAAEIRDLQPDGLLISNGPGDPAAVEGTIVTLRALLGEFPIFGICLGHQMLALALGAKTFKLPFGHHGANMPVLNEPGARVEITSQNHGFAVDPKSLARVGGVATHTNLNDQSLEGYVHPDNQVCALQFHPEASPGPHDSSYVFRRFADYVAAGKPIDASVFASTR